MKTNSPLIKALVVAGMVGTMAHMSPMAHAAATLSTTEKANLSGAASQAVLVKLAKDILNAASVSEKPGLAKEIAAYVAKNAKNKADAAQIVKALIEALPSQSTSILLAALVANPAIAADLKTAIPTQAGNVDVLVATLTVSSTGTVTTSAVVNPINNSTN